MIPSSCAEYVAAIWLAMSQVVMNWKVSCAFASPVDACVLFSTKVHAVLAPARKTSDSVVVPPPGGGVVVSPGAVVSLLHAANETTSAIAKNCRTCFILIISLRSMAAASRSPTGNRAAPKVPCYTLRVPRRFCFVSVEPARATRTPRPCPTKGLAAQGCLSRTARSLCSTASPLPGGRLRTRPRYKPPGCREEARRAGCSDPCLSQHSSPLGSADRGLENRSDPTRSSVPWSSPEVSAFQRVAEPPGIPAA